MRGTIIYLYTYLLLWSEDTSLAIIPAEDLDSGKAAEDDKEVVVEAWDGEGNGKLSSDMS